MMSAVQTSGGRSPRVLLYSPMFFGHPVVYCRVFTRLLLELGCEVIVASHGISAYPFSQWSEVGAELGDGWNIVELGGDISPKPGPMTAEALLALQREQRVDVTLFVHADYFKEQWVRLAEGSAPRLAGRNVAIFSLTAAWYPGEDNLTGRPITLRGPTLRNTLGNIRRRVLGWRETDRHFFERLIHKKVVGVVAVKDERVARRYGAPVFWMPEIYRVFGERPTAAGERQFETVAPQYARFLERHRGREVLLYFGNAAWYKGYDYALQLASADSDCVFVHCGAPDVADGAYPVDVAGLRARIAAQGRLFETGEFVLSQRLIEHFFASARRIVSTHRLAGTSGTMLQAVELEKPILTPDSGLLAYRTRTFGLGKVYRHEDSADLRHSWEEFKNLDAGTFASALRAFVAQFSESAVRQFTREQLLGAAS